MRCRKVRSCLSAYCSDELKGRRELAIREHLSACPNCRREAELYRSINTASKQLPEMTVGVDFNARLLDRIGQERFKETRSKAYLPRRAPIFGWRQLVPALSTVAVLALVAGYWFMPGAQKDAIDLTQSGERADDLYLTVQPTNNPNLTGALKKNWSLGEQMRRTDRMARISNSIMDRGGFGNLHLTSGMGGWAFDPNHRIPYVHTYYQVQPVIKVYQSSKGVNALEDEEVF